MSSFSNTHGMVLSRMHWGFTVANVGKHDVKSRVHEWSPCSAPALVANEVGGVQKLQRTSKNWYVVYACLCVLVCTCMRRGHTCMHIHIETRNQH